MVFSIEITSAGARLFKKLNPTIQQKLYDKIMKLADNPRLGQPLHGTFKSFLSYHVTVNRTAYRVVYQVNHDAETITVYGVGSRENFYKQLGRMKLKA